MSRFSEELSGAHGEHWKKYAQDQIRECLNRYENGEIIIELDGAAKWLTNENYIPDDYCEIMEAAEIPFSREVTKEKRGIQTDKYLEEYRERNKNRVYSAEELYEMRAAFGEEAEIVDVLTGEKIDLSESDNYSEQEEPEI